MSVCRKFRVLIRTLRGRRYLRLDTTAVVGGKVFKPGLYEYDGNGYRKISE